MVKYLRDGEDFGPQHFSSDFGFTQSASRKGGSMPDTNRAEAVRTRAGTKFEARDPGDMDMNDRSYDRMENEEIAREPKARGGRIKRADGGGVDDDGDVGLAKGGRIRRAFGGPIPGPAPAPNAASMTARPSAAPMAGNPLSHVQISMPASDLALMAQGAAKMGAGQAVSGLAQAARGRGGPQPVRMPGAAAIAPGAAPPPPAQGMAPVGLKRGGALTAAARKALPTKDFALPGRKYPIENESHGRNALARVAQHGSSSERAEVRSAVQRRFPDIGKKG